ncbi:MAG: dihydrolipoamide acetyltransferase family protein, partial [Bacillota bacterium]|nr:dihydrolipoamide acetyltransferase family protein [Bacillota bacterium]
DSVKKGEPLMEVSTDKIVNDVESPGEGILRKIVVPENSKVPVSALVAILAAPDEDISQLLSGAGTPEQAAPAAAPAAALKTAPAAASADSGAGEKVKASPVAKKLSEEKGIPLEKIRGTGPKGRITKEDVENYVPEASPAPGEALPEAVTEGKPLEGLRAIIAERLQESWQQAPHVTIGREVDMSALKALKEQVADQLDQRISYTDMLAVLTARTLLKHPNLNGQFADGLLYRQPAVHLGIAVALPDGLMVPVVKNAHHKTMTAVHEEMADLSQKARFNRLSGDELSGATFTITNLGMEGVDMFTPIINPPECAILGVGRMVDKPVYEGEHLVRRPLMWLSLSFDHRVVDGQAAARFMADLDRSIRQPGMVLV